MFKAMIKAMMKAMDDDYGFKAPKVSNNYEIKCPANYPMRLSRG